MLILDDAEYPLVAFSVGLPGGIQLSQLLTPVTRGEDGSRGRQLEGSHGPGNG